MQNNLLYAHNYFHGVIFIVLLRCGAQCHTLAMVVYIAKMQVTGRVV